MYLGNSEMELLQLAAWCKNLPSDMSKSIHSRVFEPARIGLLDRVGLLMVTENRKSIRLREGGWRLLEYLGYSYHKDSSYRSSYDKRIEISRILLTFRRAGFNVFGASVTDMGTSQVFVSSMAARRDAVRGGDIWGGAAFWGLGCLGNTVASCYYFTRHEKSLFNYRNERALLDKAAVILGAKPAMVFAGNGSMGSGYLRMAKTLGNNGAAKATNPDGKLTYSDIYHTATASVHLLECSDAGALQLLIMAQPDYRKRLINAMFQNPLPPVVGVAASDGSLRLSDDQTYPFIIAVDMDIWRINRAVRQTLKAGCGMLVVACLQEQKDALEYMFVKPAATIIDIKEQNLTDAFAPLRLYEPQPGPYLDSKGGMIDATALPVYRKMGKQAHRKNTEVQE